MSAAEASHLDDQNVGDRDADMSKAFVMEAIQRLVDGDLARWDRTEDGELELRLATGETFIMGDAGITATKEPRDAAPMSSTDRRGSSLR